FNEMRVASRGGTADYSGITWDKIVANQGVFWPCPQTTERGRTTKNPAELDTAHPGTPRLYEGGASTSRTARPASTP
ncbi:hypothetical protein CTI14_45620, partial [Methylobacterium radiotolerans]